MGGVQGPKSSSHVSPVISNTEPASLGRSSQPSQPTADMPSPTSRLEPRWSKPVLVAPAKLSDEAIIQMMLQLNMETDKQKNELSANEVHTIKQKMEVSNRERAEVMRNAEQKLETAKKLETAAKVIGWISSGAMILGGAALFIASFWTGAGAAAGVGLMAAGAVGLAACIADATGVTEQVVGLVAEHYVMPRLEPFLKLINPQMDQEEIMSWSKMVAGVGVGVAVGVAQLASGVGAVATAKVIGAKIAAKLAAKMGTQIATMAIAETAKATAKTATAGIKTFNATTTFTLKVGEAGLKTGEAGHQFSAAMDESKVANLRIEISKQQQLLEDEMENIDRVLKRMNDSFDAVMDALFNVSQTRSAIARSMA